MSERGQHPDDEQTRDQQTLEMDDQEPSYGSSYNESQPGEITDNRRRSLREQESSDENMSGGS